MNRYQVRRRGESEVRAAIDGWNDVAAQIHKVRWEIKREKAISTT